VLRTTGPKTAFVIDGSLAGTKSNSQISRQKKKEGWEWVWKKRERGNGLGGARKLRGRIKAKGKFFTNTKPVDTSQRGWPDAERVLMGEMGLSANS